MYIYIHIYMYTYIFYAHTHTYIYVYICIQAGGSDGKDYLQCPRFDSWDRKIPQATHSRHEAETEQQQQENKGNKDSGLD